MARADQLADDGKLVDARKIWNSIVTLYGDNREMAAQVEQAQSRLNNKGPKDAKDNKEPAAESSRE